MKDLSLLGSLGFGKSVLSLGIESLSERSSTQASNAKAVGMKVSEKPSSVLALRKYLCFPACGTCWLHCSNLRQGGLER